MALEANAYERADASTDGVVPNLYDEIAEKYIYEAEKFRPLGIDKSAQLKSTPGKTLQVFKETQFTVSTLTEGTDTPVSALDFGSITLTLAWYGDAKQISLENLSETFDFVWDDIKLGASGALGTNRDNIIMTEWLTTTEDAVYPRNSSGVAYTSANIIAGLALSYSQLVETRTEMRKDRRKMNIIVVHPDQVKDLLNDEKFIDADYNGGQSMAVAGALGKMAGATFIEHTAVQTTVEGTTGTGTCDVYQAIALGERAFIYAQKVDPVFELDREYNRKRGLTFHYYEAFGVANLHDESIRIIKSS